MEVQMGGFFNPQAPKPTAAATVAAAGAGFYELVVTGKGDDSKSAQSSTGKRPAVANGKPKKTADRNGMVRTASAEQVDETEKEQEDEDYKPDDAEYVKDGSDDDEGESEEVDEAVENAEAEAKASGKVIDKLFVKQTYMPSDSETLDWKGRKKVSPGADIFTSYQKRQLPLYDSPLYILDGPPFSARYIRGAQDKEGFDEYVLFVQAAVWTFGSKKRMLEWVAGYGGVSAVLSTEAAVARASDEKQLPKAKKTKPKQPKTLKCLKCGRTDLNHEIEARRQALFLGDPDAPDPTLIVEPRRFMMGRTEVDGCGDCIRAPPASDFKSGIHDAPLSADTEENAKDEEALLEAVLDANDKYANEGNESDESAEDDDETKTSINLESEDSGDDGGQSKHIKKNANKQASAKKAAAELEDSRIAQADMSRFVTVDHGIPEDMHESVIRKVKFYLDSAEFKTDRVLFVEHQVEVHCTRAAGQTATVAAYVARTLDALVSYYIRKNGYEGILEADISMYVTPANGITASRKAAVSRELMKHIKSDAFKSNPEAFVAQWHGKSDPEYRILSQLIAVHMYGCLASLVLAPKSPFAAKTGAIPPASTGSKSKPISNEDSVISASNREERRILESEVSLEARELMRKRKLDDSLADARRANILLAAANKRFKSNEPADINDLNQLLAESDERNGARLNELSGKSSVQDDLRRRALISHAPMNDKPKGDANGPPLDRKAQKIVEDAMYAPLEPPIAASSLPVAANPDDDTSAASIRRKTAAAAARSAAAAAARSAEFSAKAKQSEYDRGFAAGEKKREEELKKQIVDKYCACIICYNPEEGVFVLKCGHSLCFDCRKTMITTQSFVVCPVCNIISDQRQHNMFYKYQALVSWLSGGDDADGERTYKRVHERNLVRTTMAANIQAIDQCVQAFKNLNGKSPVHMAVKTAAEDMNVSIAEWKRKSRHDGLFEVTFYQQGLYVHKKGDLPKDIKIGKAQ